MSQNRMLRTSVGTRAGAFGPNEWALTIACGLIWGASFLWIAVGLESFAPNFITWLRIAAGLAAISCMPSSWKRIERRDWPAIVFLGIFYMAFPLALFPVLHGANADLNQTLAMGLIVIIVVQWYSIRVLGLGGYLKRFTKPFELPLRNVKLAEFVGGLDGFRGVYVRDQAPGQLEGGVHLRNELPAFSCRGRREVG